MLFLQQIACDIDFNDSEAYAGTCFFIGLVVAFIGIVKISNSKHQWNLFYDNRDKKDLNSPILQKDRKVGIIMLVVGIVMMIASNFII